MQPKIYGISLSLYVRKVRFLLEYKGVDYDLEPVIPVKPPEGFREISPIGKIPALKLDDFTISDSSVICQYLDKKYPEKPLIPEKAEEMARSLWFDEYSDTRMSETMSRIFFENFGRPLLFKAPPDQERIAELETQVPAVLEYLEKVLEGKKFLLGEDLSFGDLGVISNLYNYIACGYESELAKWPNLKKYYDRCINLPCISSVLRKERREVPLPAK